jgi:hypothetical protein
MDNYASYAAMITKAQSEREKEYDNHKTEMQLCIKDLEELLRLELSCDLRTKLANALRKARHDYDLKDVDFGDLKED